MLFTRRKRNATVPEVGSEAPEFNLPSAQGGQLRLSMRTVRGPVVVAFFRGMWSEEDIGYFSALAAKEDEINRAGASVVGIGAVEAAEAREFARASGIKSYVLYDYHRVTTGQWGLLDKDREHGEYARPAVFVVGTDRNVTHAWVGERPSPDELLATVSGITGLPKPAEEAEEEKPKGRKKGAEDGETTEEAPAAAEEKPKKLSAEERERIKAERRAAREAGKSVRTAGQAGGAAATEAPDAGQAAGGEAGAQPKKMSAEERERIKAERRAAREAGKSVKTDAPEATTGAAGGEASGEAEKPKKMSAEERERIKAERRAAREAGKSLKKPAVAPEAGTEDGAGASNEDAAPVAEVTEPPKANGE